MTEPLISARLSARSALQDEARRLRERADQLDGLALTIPDDFPKGADLALWQLVMDSRM